MGSEMCIRDRDSTTTVETLEVDLEVFGFVVEEAPGFNVRVRSLLLFVVLSVIFLSFNFIPIK